ncbi:MAG: ATP-binding protein [Devosia sp.]
MNSIRARLFVILIATTGLVWLSAVGWIFVSTRAEVEQVLDARLSEAGRMVSSLVSSQEIDVQRVTELGGQMLPVPSHIPYDRQLSCQLWSFDGTLVGRSDGAPAAELSNHTSGFSEVQIDGETWRVFAIENEEKAIRVLVGDSLRVRDRLVGDVVKGLLFPAALILPVLAGLIWVSVNRGLMPLDRMANDLAGRKAADLKPLPQDGPREIRPVIKALNGLFARVVGARQHERDFTAFAAHELKTPLAGLKTQAQIALASQDDAITREALAQIVSGVDRTSRLVRQLLAIAALEASEGDDRPGIEDLGVALRALVRELPHHGQNKVRIEIGAELDGLGAAIGEADFDLAARNVLENAVAHSPAGGSVKISGRAEAGAVVVAIADHGAGMPADELVRATERFFRGRNKTAVGSGLGLSIAQLALERSGGRLILSNGPAGGLLVEMTVPVA